MRSLTRILALALIYTASTCLYGRLYAQNETQTVSTEITCTAENPADGSMWMGTSGEGLYRLGKNGSRLHFSASSGKIGSDYIIYICFDQTGKLWIVDKSGTLTSYTSEEGFQKSEVKFDEISRAIYLPKEGSILIAGVTKYSTFSTLTSQIINEAEIPFEPNELRLSTDSSYVWLFGENKVAKLFADGQAAEWESKGTISNSLPLEFETYTEQNTAGLGLAWIIAIILGVVLAVVVVVLIFRKRSSGRPNKPQQEHIEYVKEPSPSVQSEPAVEPVKEPQKEIEIEVEKTPKTAAPKPEPVTKSKPEIEPVNAEFTTRVMMLIEEHISEPDFDVESIAALTGISRIHVNRKLKAEGSPSPSAMIKQKRMDVAKFLLLQSDLSMSQIASECGFRSPSYFTTAFKEYTGLTPSDFVAQNKL